MPSSTSGVGALPGQDTLLACWSRLAELSPGARVVRSSATATAVFPSWAPLNNAIMLSAHDGSAAGMAASQLRTMYADVGVEAWALWLPSRTTDWDEPDELRAVEGMKRDTTTLVMHATVPQGLKLHDAVVRVSLAALTRIANDEAVPVSDLGAPDAAPGLLMWAMVQDDLAVACAYSFLHEGDCGIYAVGTLPRWRRQGLARSLMEHVLAEAQRRGA